MKSKTGAAKRPISQQRPAPQTNRGLVLVVDDEPSVCAVAKFGLERSGYSAIAADTLEAALQLLRDRGADIALVLLDVNIPGSDAAATVRAIREIRGNVPVLLSSGGSEADARGQIPLEAIGGFLQKPFTFLQLAEAVERALAAPRAGSAESR